MKHFFVIFLLWASTATSQNIVTLPEFFNTNPTQVDTPATTVVFILSGTDFLVVVNSPNNDLVLVFPRAANTQGFRWTVKNVGARKITLDGNGSDLIDNAQTDDLPGKYSAKQIISNGTQLLITGEF